MDPKLHAERKKDHYSHFILRLAFSSTEDLRRRFARIETALFKVRFQNDDASERQKFVQSLSFDWEAVSDEEKRALGPQLLSGTPGLKKNEMEDGGWFKVDFETVPELVESRRVFLKAGKAYVPVREQMSMVLAGFAERLDKGLEVYYPPIRPSLHASFTKTLADIPSLPLAPSPASTKTTAYHPSLPISRRTLPRPTPTCLTLTPLSALLSPPPASTMSPNISPSACATCT